MTKQEAATRCLARFHPCHETLLRKTVTATYFKANFDEGREIVSKMSPAECMMLIANTFHNHDKHHSTIMLQTLGADPVAEPMLTPLARNLELSNLADLGQRLTVAVDLLKDKLSPIVLAFGIEVYRQNPLAYAAYFCGGLFTALFDEEVRKEMEP